MTVGRGAIAVAVMSLAVPAPASSAGAGAVVDATRIRHLLASHSVVLTRVTISGRLDLRPLGEVRQQFVCRDCTFDGGIIASGTIFTRTFDLSGSHVQGPTLLQEARFLGPLLFGAPPGDRATRFEGPADFRLVSAGDLVSFENASFEAPTDFTLARFATDGIFTYAVFGRAATFERAAFGTSSDFRLVRFAGDTDFSGAQFTGPADFTGATFARPTQFDLARFDRNASFYGTRFTSPSSTPVRFAQVTSGGNLDFRNATINPKSWFWEVTAAGAVSFTGAQLPDDESLVFTGFAAHDLFLCADCVLRSVQSYDQPAVLQLIESTAKARGDLGAANAADYSLHVLRSRTYNWPRRLLDVVFYRGVAGYLVRPLRPLLVLLVLAGIVSLLRFHRAVAKAHPRLSRAAIGKRLRAEAHAVPLFFGMYFDTLTLPFRRLPESARGGGLVGQRLEVLVYRVLLVCVLVGLANSNPTLRQMVDALR